MAISPFLPHPDVVSGTLRHLGLPAIGDAVADEIRLARELNYEPMFMTDCPGTDLPLARGPRAFGRGHGRIDVDRGRSKLAEAGVTAPRGVG